MRRVLVVAVVIALLQVAYAAPSSAIFGLSQCEKMWKAVGAEEAVGLLLWRKFYSSAAQVDRVESPTQWMWGRLASMAIPLFESDLKIYKSAIANPECFTTRSNADLRAMNQEAQERLGEMKSVVRYTQNSPEQVRWHEKTKWIPLYPKYYMLKDVTD